MSAHTGTILFFVLFCFVCQSETSLNTRELSGVTYSSFHEHRTLSVNCENIEHFKHYTRCACLPFKP